MKLAKNLRRFNLIAALFFVFNIPIRLDRQDNIETLLVGKSLGLYPVRNAITEYFTSLLRKKHNSVVNKY